LIRITAIRIHEFKKTKDHEFRIMNKMQLGLAMCAVQNDVLFVGSAGKTTVRTGRVIRMPEKMKCDLRKTENIN
jgi:hypothetical protein